MTSMFQLSICLMFFFRFILKQAGSHECKRSLNTQINDIIPLFDENLSTWSLDWRSSSFYAELINASPILTHYLDKLNWRNDITLSLNLNSSYHPQITLINTKCGFTLPNSFFKPINRPSSVRKAFLTRTDTQKMEFQNRV